MMWGAFSAAGIGELLHWEKSFKSCEKLPTIEKSFSKEEQLDVTFQQDNTLAQIAKTTNKSIRLMF